MAISLLSKLLRESDVELWFDIDIVAVLVALLGFLVCEFDVVRVFVEVDVVKLLFIHLGEIKLVHFKNGILILNEFDVCLITFTIISFIKVDVIFVGELPLKIVQLILELTV